jgi:hypothetical protein
MRWLTDRDEFESVLGLARTCVSIDSSRIPTSLQRVVFDDALIGNGQFAALVQRLLCLAGDDCAYLIVLDPDPVHYFHRLFGEYPVVEILPADSPQAYLDALNKPHQENPAEAIGNTWSTSVIAARSGKWFVHAIRSADDAGAHLWVDREITRLVQSQFPFLRD